MSDQRTLWSRPMNHVHLYSGGLGSWAATRRGVGERGGLDRTLLVHTDTLSEDFDLYRFLVETAAGIAGVRATDLVEAARATPPLRGGMAEADKEARRRYLRNLAAEAQARIPILVWLADGRDVWQVFRDKRFIGNTMVDPCSRILKRELFRSWLESRFASDEVTVYLGMDWSEGDRFAQAQRYWAPYAADAPLYREPYLGQGDHLKALGALGIAAPRLYALGFGHNNCAGGCVKAGQAQWKLLLERLPEVFAYYEDEEEMTRRHIDADRSVLRVTEKGERRPMTLREFRLRVGAGSLPVDPTDIGGCGCFVGATA